MRVLHINCNYIGTTLHQLMIKKLDALGIQNDVFVPTHDIKTAIITPNENVYVSECFRKRDRLIFGYKQKKIIEAIEEHYDIKKFDLIHAYTLFTDGNCARYLSQKYGMPYVVAVRNTDVYDFFKKRVYLRGLGVTILKNAQKVFFLSEPYQKKVLEAYVPRESQNNIIKKSMIIPNGIDDFWFTNIPKEEKKISNNIIKLVYAGTIDKNKNITATQSAMDILKSKGVDSYLTVIGKIVEQSEYNKVLRGRNTTYVLPQTKEELIKLYRKNDIFVMPSIHETFGLVYAEAISQGLPVIYSQGQGFDGQFEEGIVGYHVNSNNPNEIAEAILRILLRYKIITTKCTSCASKFCWDKICSLYFDIYKELVE